MLPLNAELYLANNDGSKQQKVADTLILDTNIAWSSEGHYLAFGVTQNSSPTLEVIDTSGNIQLRIPAEGLVGSEIIWIP
jgi:hypothetical protein